MTDASLPSAGILVLDPGSGSLLDMCARLRAFMEESQGETDLTPEVGSSSSSTLGLISSSWPMLTRLRSPPLMPFLKKPPATRTPLA
jgi:hypothetical protein